DYLIAIPERRKTLVYVSPGVPVNPEALAPALASPAAAETGALKAREVQIRLFEELQQIFTRAQRANVNIYPVDTAGLGGVEDGVRKRLRAQGAPGAPAMGQAHKIEKQNNAFLRETAENPGGPAIVDTNDFDEGLASLFRENGSYYVLAYRQSNPKGP